ncbi:P-aminobenzoate synthetase, component I [Alteromonas macleodii str. 'Black Sea 11']|nr:P-aminobenzoate synthetase, component I [Alteromonas macleodii str. 'Black Sea 11']NKW89571.1 aminodeoxychorismate synthase component I [Alteromonadaceae bacterium A_SAG4]NKX04231.1 aminodeoxychorismate synthase component I [Alteromonadaceae bacterium A_SAG6]NKX18035.1 aminodeoxychorismate synthase component I [Alteromonadaceae bacterium A_SAG5]NKX35038.1 aminodeoxychorismate synthase component I [Alteromonadaceae bacterium A_SAG3]
MPHPDTIHVHVSRFTPEALVNAIPLNCDENESVFNSLFEHVSALPYSILLDTSGSSKSEGRFNIMAFSPSAVIEAKGDSVELIDVQTSTRQKLTLPPFEAVQTHLHARVSNVILHGNFDTEHLPFIVGVAGMAGYDTGRFYEVMPNIAKDDYDTPDFTVGLYLCSLIEDTQTGYIYYCSADNQPLEQLFSSFDNQQSSSAFKLTSRFESNLSKDAYEVCLDKIHAYLRAGDCYQVNMAQRFSAGFEGNLWHAYRELRSQNQAPFSAFYKLPQGSIASISPERFLRVKNGVVETKPIKGTRPRFKDKAKDAESAQSLLMAEKDRAENLMIVDLLRNDISKHCKPHSVKVPALFALESYEAVHHLVSTVTGELNETSSPLELLASAFPGGSITGAPKIRAMEVIDELEPHRRNIYCGSVFYMGFREDMDSSICIRTVLAENHRLHCWAGGGIVLDSVASEEYQETLDKVSKILPVLESLNQ